MMPAMTHESAAQPALDLATLAHELRQPLSHIESIAYYLSLVLPRGDHKLQEQVARLQQLVEQSNRILSAGLQLSGTLPSQNRPLDLEELVTAAATAQLVTGRPRFKLELLGGSPLIALDPSRGRTLVELILGLLGQFATIEHPVVVRTKSEAGSVLLSMECRAAVLRSPSDLGPGSALIIEAATRIASSPGGAFHWQVSEESGAQFVCRLPIEAAA